MRIRTESMNNEDLTKMNQTLARSLRILKKIGLYLFGFSAVMLFIPLDILKFFAKRGARRNVSGIMFNDIGLQNTILFIILPIIILLIIIYFFGANKIKKDIKNQKKEIGTVKVKEIKELSERDKKDLMGTADHILKFEKNSFKIDETYFLKSKQPELMNAKAYLIEISKIAKVELNGKIVNNIA